MYRQAPSRLLVAKRIVIISKEKTTSRKNTETGEQLRPLIGEVLV